MTATVNLFAAPASTLAASTVAFIDANKGADSASTPFARSTLATIVGGIASASMVESIVIAAMGAPKSPKTGKPIAKVSGLRDFDGGARLYQAWKDIAFIVDNIDADAWVVAPADTDVPLLPTIGLPGANAIRPLVEGFILNASDAPKALFGATGLTHAVKAAMAEHSKAIALHAGVAPVADATPADADATKDDAPATVDVSGMAGAMLVALRSLDDAAFIDAKDALAMLSDYIDARWNAIADAGETVQSIAA